MNVVMKHSKSKKKWLSRIISGLLSMAMLTTNVTSLSTVRAEGQSVPLPEERQVEKLDRGLMAIKVRDGVYLSWRFLGTDGADTAFHIYRDGNRITDTPITGSPSKWISLINCFFICSILSFSYSFFIGISDNVCNDKEIAVIGVFI